MTTLAADSAPVHLVDSKLDAKHEEYPDGSEASNTNARDRTYEGQGSALEKKLMRKIDFRLIPPLCEANAAEGRHEAYAHLYSGFMYACALIGKDPLHGTLSKASDALLLRPSQFIVRPHQRHGW